MDIKKLIIIVIIASVIVSAFLLTAMSYMSKRKHIDENEEKQKYNKRFRFYYDFVLTRSTFRNIHSQVSNLAVYDFMEARVTTVKFFERAMLSGLALFIVGFIGLGDLVSGIVLMMFALVMLNTVVNNRVDDINFQSLKDMSRLILSVRECYTRVRNVPDAINDAQCPPLLKRNLDDIYLICTANDARTRLEEFYKKCPNRIMRTFATTCYIRSDAGDDDNGKTYSPFKQALGLIKDEVDMEVRRQVNQRLLFNSLDKLPFVPLFLYPPIKLFYTSIISATASVFDSGIGFIIKLTVVLACFVAYYVLSTINNSSVARVDDRLLSLTNLMHRTSVQKFARTLVTKKFRKRHEVKRALEGCLSQKTIDYFYLERFVYGTALFFISMLFSVLIMISSKNAVYNSLSSTTMSVTLTYTAEQERLTREYDAAVLAMDALPPEEEMEDTFVKIFPKESSVFVDTQVERLTAKYKNYHNLSFKWWFAFIYIGVAIIGWFIPVWLLKLRQKLVRSEAEMDVLQLQTIIAILMDTSLDTMSVIYWLAKSSDIHKDVLSYCYHEYARDPEFALNHLKSKSDNVEFKSMCDKLITTIHQVTLAEAFEDLVSERENTMKVREVVQLDQLKSKRNIAGPIATAPMMVWMVMVFIVPIGVVAIRSAISMLGQLNM